MLGFVTGFAADPLPAWATVVGSGLLGGYTTFSTAAVESMRLLRQRRWAATVATGPGQLVLTVGLALTGLVAGRLL